MASKSNLKLFLLLLAAMAALSLVSGSVSNDLINKVCSKHTDGNFCRAQLGKASFSDISGLATVSIDLTKARANTRYIKALLGKEKNARAKSALEDCLSEYSSAADSMDEARASFKAKDFLKMNCDAAAASTSAGTCEQGFTDFKLASPLTSQNKALQNSAQIVEIVANLLNGGARFLCT